jgi:hypothetical protein
MALSGHAVVKRPCPLSVAKRTSSRNGRMSAYDPKRTSGLIQNNSGLPKDLSTPLWHVEREVD